MTFYSPFTDDSSVHQTTYSTLHWILFALKMHTKKRRAWTLDPSRPDFLTWESCLPLTSWVTFRKSACSPQCWVATCQPWLSGAMREREREKKKQRIEQCLTVFVTRQIWINISSPFFPHVSVQSKFALALKYVLSPFSHQNTFFKLSQI